MANCILSSLFLALVFCEIESYAHRCSPQQCAATFLNAFSRRLPRGEQMEAMICEEYRRRTDSSNEPIHNNHGSSRGSNKHKEVRSPLRDWNKVWERPSPSSSRREEEVYEQIDKDSYEEEIQYEESVPIYDADRMDLFPFFKNFELSDPMPSDVLNSNKDSSRFDRISSISDKDKRRNSDSLRQRSFALSPNLDKTRQIRRSK